MPPSFASLDFLFRPARMLGLIVGCTLLAGPARAQFLDDFSGPKADGWFQMVGDGTPTASFTTRDGVARIDVDGSTDRHNVWWVIIKRDVSAALDLEKLNHPEYELRVEARVRASHAPRRVNFMLNTQRTTDFHEHLREYDLPDTTQWHTISMTTRDFDARPGDAVYVQLGVTDWGPGKYHLDIDYYRADVVRRDAVSADLGEPLVYHPPVPALGTFAHHLRVSHDSVIDREYPEVNFGGWRIDDASGSAPVLTVGTSTWPILRWDFASMRNLRTSDAGVLELTTHSVAKGGNYVAAFGEDLGIEFGKVRIIEILSGDPTWDQRTVTYASLLGSEDAAAVFNSQMTFDAELAPPGQSTLITLPRPVMQRLLDGRTRGLVLRPLGAISASIYASEDAAGRGPRLHFSAVPDAR